MYNLKINEDQVRFLYELLDSELKCNGLPSLVKVVGINNALLSMTVEELEVDKPEEDNQPAEEGKQEGV